MGRSPSSDENGLKKGPWTPEEDQKLMQYIQEHGLGSWRALPKLAGLNRCGKSCRLRWTNYLRPDIKRGKFSQDEEQTILHLHSILGNKWSAIASHLPGRTDNEIKNFWNTHLRKKLIQMGFDPMTHQPRTDLFSTLPQLISLLNLRDLMEHYPQHQYPLDEQTLKFQSESVQLAKLQCLQYLLQSAAANSTTTTTTTTIADMEVSNLLNSINIPPIKENPILNSLQLENIIAPQLTSLENIASSSCHHLLHHPIIPLTHLPADPQAVPFSDFQTLLPLNNHDDQMMGQASSFTVVNQGDNYFQNYPPNSSWVNNNITSPSPSLSPEFSVPPPATEILMNNNIIQGDENSTSSYGGGGGGASSSSYWPELLFEDPLMHEIP